MDRQAGRPRRAAWRGHRHSRTFFLGHLCTIQSAATITTSSPVHTPWSMHTMSPSSAMTKIPSALWPSVDIPPPGVRHVLTQIAHFFDQLGYEDAFRALLAEANKKNIVIDIAEWERGITEEHTAPLLELWEEWYRQNGGFPMLSDPSPDRPSKKSRATAKNETIKSSSEDEGNGEVESDGDSSDEENGSDGDNISKKDKAKAVKGGEKRKREDTPSSSSDDSSSDHSSSEDDSSSDDSSSEEEDEKVNKRKEKKRGVPATSTHSEKVKRGTAPSSSENKSIDTSGSKRKREATPPSSSDNSSDEETDDSSSDDSSSSDSDARPSKKAKHSRRSDSSSDDSSSDASSASQSDDSSDASSGDDSNSSSGSDDSSDSDSDDSSSDSSAPPPPKKKAKLADPEPEPERGSTSSATLDHETDTRVPSSTKNKHGKAPKTKHAKPVSVTDTLPVSADGKDSPSEDPNNDTSSMHPDRLRRMPAAHDRGDRPQKGSVPFSRIPKDQQVDPRFASNDYIPYDYANRAYQDLSVTRGKGFTKEKNKKKRGMSTFPVA